MSTNNKNIIEKWFSLRYSIFYLCLSQDFYIEKKEYNLKKFFNNLKNLFLNFFHILKIPFLIKKKDLLVIDIGTYKLFEGKMNDPISPILMKNNIDHNLISIANNSFILKKQINISLILKLIHLFLNKKKTRVNKESDEFIYKKINKYFPDFKINKKFLRNNIENQQYSIFLVTKFFIKLLKPKKVIYHEIPSLFQLIKYCNQNDIETNDLQHSLISELNILYQFKLPQKFSDLISQRVLIWGNYWKQFYSRNDRCHVVGHFGYLQPQNIKKRKILMIISSVYSRGKLLDLADKLSSDFTDYKILYKLRPNEFMPNSELVLKLKKKKNFSFLNITPGKQFEVLLNKSEYVIGVNSTLLIESVGKAEVVVYKTGWHEEYSNLVDQKIFLSAKNYFEMRKIINNKLKGNKTDNSIFFSPYIKENFNFISNHDK